MPSNSPITADEMIDWLMTDLSITRPVAMKLLNDWRRASRVIDRHGMERMTERRRQREFANHSVRQGEG